MWKWFKRGLVERFASWETANGAFIFIPWGAGFVYYGLPSKELLLQYSIWHERFGYNYGMVSLGIVLMVWGIGKLSVNRIKYRAKRALLIEARKKEFIIKGDLK